MTDIVNIHEIDPVLVDVPMPIITPRLILRPCQAGNGAAVAKAIGETWEDLNRWMLWAKDDTKDENLDPVKREIFCRRQYAKFLLREDLMMLAFERTTNKMVSGTGLHRINWRTRNFEIGYWVRKSMMGNGYANEATNALLRYAFTALHANIVHICHAEGNERSRRVIEKLGFIKVGDRPFADERTDGTISGDSQYYRIDTNGLPDLEVRWGEEL